MVESSEKLLHALLITEISKEDYTDLEISGLFQKSHGGGLTEERCGYKFRQRLEPRQGEV
jgi:hypothetical protein